MNELCAICEAGTAHEKMLDREAAINGIVYVVHDDQFLECDRCGERYYTDAQSKAAARKLCDARRRFERLLTGDQIKRLRQSLLLSQVQLEKALGVASKTVVRWESGTASQSKALDDVLRLIEFDPDNLRMLVRVRDASLAPLIDQKLSSQDHKGVGELTAAVYAGLEKASVESSLVQNVTSEVVNAILEHRRERLESLFMSGPALGVPA